MPVIGRLRSMAAVVCLVATTAPNINPPIRSF
jgi:hypothetical protein